MEENSENSLVIQDSYFSNNSLDLVENAKKFGFVSQEIVERLNADKYLRNLELLEHDGMKLQIMPEKSKEMILTALYQNFNAIIYVENQTSDLKQFCMDRNWNSLCLFKEQKEDVDYALGKSADAITCAKKPTQEQIIRAMEMKVDLIKSINKKFIGEEVVKYFVDFCIDKKCYEQISMLPREFFTEDFSKLLVEHDCNFVPYVKLDSLEDEEILNFIDIAKYPRGNFFDYEMFCTMLSHHIKNFSQERQKKFVYAICEKTKKEKIRYGYFINCLLKHFSFVITVDFMIEIMKITPFSFREFIDGYSSQYTKQGIYDLIVGNLLEIFEHGGVFYLNEHTGFQNDKTIRFALKKWPKQLEYVNKKRRRIKYYWLMKLNLL